MPCPSHPSYLIILIWRRVQVMKHLIMQFTSSSYHIIPLRSKCSSQLPVLKHLSVHSSLNVRDQVSHP
jgi:hypothetical protein